MALDPSIALQIRPAKIDSPMESMGQAMQLQGLIQRQQLGQMQMDEHRETRAEKEAVKGAFIEAKGDLSASADLLQSRGLYGPALKVRASLAEQAKAMQEGQKLRFEVMAKRKELQKTLIAGAASDPSPSGLAAVAQEMVSTGIMDEDGARRWHADVSAAGSPTAIQRKLVEWAREPRDMVEMYKPKYQTVDDGQTTRVIDANLMNNPGAANPIQMRMTPGQVQSSADSAASRGVQIRGQNLTNDRAIQANSIAATGAGVKATEARTKDTDDLRKEFATLPEVKDYKALIPAQRSAADAIKRDTAQADINLIYATSKSFDPTSVVREGEYATVNSSQAPAERLSGMLSFLQGGGKLTAQTRNALMAEINSRAEAGKTSYDAARTSYKRISEKRGMSEADVFADLPEQSRPEVTPVAPPAPRETGKPAPSATVTPAAVSAMKPTDRMPMPRDAPVGVIIVDSVTGKRMKNTGKAWVPE